MHDELLRLVDSIQMEKGINRDLLFDSLESALVSAARKKYAEVEELRVKIDRESGEIRLLDGDRPIGTLDPAEFGRIAAQTAKQVMIQRIREAESDVVYEEYAAKAGTLVNGVIQRIERGTVILNIGKADGILPRQEQIPSENYRLGERLRCYVTSVRKKGNKVVIILSRTHPDLVKDLFELEVPEIYDHIVEIKGLVREPGFRTKIAVSSSDSRVDAVGACVGVRGSRIRNIVEELNGEKIDIVRWSEADELFIRNSLSPAEIESIEFDKRGKRARVIVPEDQLSLAIGKKGQNVRLSSKLTGWDLDIMTVDEHRAWRERGRQEIASLPGVGESTVNSFLLGGFESFRDIVELGVEALTEIKGIGEKKAEEIYNFALEGYHKRMEEEARAAAEARAAREAARRAGTTPGAAAETAAPAESAGATPEGEAPADGEAPDTETAGADLASALSAPAPEGAPDAGGAEAEVDTESAGADLASALSAPRHETPPETDGAGAESEADAAGADLAKALVTDAPEDAAAGTEASDDSGETDAAAAADAPAPAEDEVRSE